MNTPVTMFLIYVLLLVIPITLIGNTLVILVLLRLKRSLRVTTHYILLNIAACDLLAGLLSQPIMLFNLTFWDADFHQSQPWLCNLMGITSATLIYVSFFTVAGIALERCLIVRLKHRYKVLITPRRMITAIVCIWVFGVLMVYPIPYLYCPSLHFLYRKERHMCVFSDNAPAPQDLVPRLARQISDNQTVHNPNISIGTTTTATFGVQLEEIRLLSFSGDEGCKKIVAYVESFVMMAVPVLVVIISSIILIVSLLKRNICQSDVITRSVQTVVIMMVGFTICVVPYCSTVGISPADVGGDGMLVLIFLMQLHSAINPAIYLLRSSKFRIQAFQVGSVMVRSVERGRRGTVRAARRVFTLKQTEATS